MNIVCPLCRPDAARSASNVRARRIGRPFGSCGTCGRLAPSPGLFEWDGGAPGDKLAVTLRFAGLGLIVGGMLGAAALLAAQLSGREVAGLWFAAVLVGFPLIGTAFGLGALGKRVAASRQRMGDPMYRAKLMEFELQERESAQASSAGG